MYRHPDLVHKLMELLTETYIEWILVQKDHIGMELDEAYATLYGAWIPKGKGGAFMGDDAAAYLSPHLYKEFVAPYDERVLSKFGGGLIHWCGDARHNYENFLRIPHCTAFHNDSMGHLDALAELKNMTDKHVITSGDSPLDIENYWKDALRLLAPNGGYIARDNSGYGGRSSGYTAGGAGTWSSTRKGGYTRVVREMNQLEIAHYVSNLFNQYGKYPLRGGPQ